MSPYVYCAGNPVKLIDPDGQKPTPAEAARIAAHVYGDKSDDILTGGWRVSQKDWGIPYVDPITGLKSQVYERVVDGVTEYVYATAGTENAKDWGENLKQPLGLSDQYKQSVEYAEQLSAALPNDELNFVGHSLGGGEAALNSLVTYGDGAGREAFTFNAAGVGALTKIANGGLKTMFKSERNINAYILNTDPLNLVQNNIPLMPDVNGKKNYLSPRDVSSVFNGHSVNNILKNFEGE